MVLTTPSLEEESGLKCNLYMIFTLSIFYFVALIVMEILSFTVLELTFKMKLMIECVMMPLFSLFYVYLLVVLFTQLSQLRRHMIKLDSEH